MELYRQIPRIWLTKCLNKIVSHFGLNKRVMRARAALQSPGWPSNCIWQEDPSPDASGGSPGSSCGPTLPGPNLPRDRARVMVTAMFQAPESPFYSPAKSPWVPRGSPQEPVLWGTPHPPPSRLLLALHAHALLRAGTPAGSAAAIHCTIPSPQPGTMPGLSGGGWQSKVEFSPVISVTVT